MHITITNPNNGDEEACVCIDRNNMSCHVLTSSLDQLNNLASIAKTQGVPETRLVVLHNKELNDELTALGWKLSDELGVYVKK